MPIYRTRNFTATSPNWTTATGDVTGTLKDFALDPYDPTNKACCVSTTGVWVTGNLNAEPPAWTQVVTPAAFLSATSKTLSQIVNVRYTITYSGLFVVQAITADSYVYVGRTLDNGATWTWRQIGTTTATVWGLWISQHSADKCWTSGGGGLYRSTNVTGGFTFSAMTGWTGGEVANIEVPYADNSDDATIIASGMSSGYGYYLLRSFDTTMLASDASAGSPDNSDGIARANNILAATSDTNTQWVKLLNDEYIEFDLGAAYTLSSIRAYWWSNGSLRNHTLYAKLNSGDAYTTVLASWINSGNSVDTVSTQSFGGSSSYRYLKLKHNNFLGSYTLLYNLSVYVSSGAVPGNSILRSDDGGITWSDITPSQGGAPGFRGLHTHTLDKETITALVGVDASSLDLVESTDGGATWTTLQSGLSGATALWRWPTGYSSVFLADDTAPYYSTDGGVTLDDKTGDIAGYANPRVSVPVWVRE